jgi:hypothetical protein
MLTERKGLSFFSGYSIVRRRKVPRSRKAGPILTTKDAIVVIRSDKEQAAYDAPIE